MNAVDATDREAQSDTGTPPSLLVIILDTNPNAWALLKDTLPLSKAVANLLVFINAHLAINNANRVGVIASHSQKAQWLYPTPSLPSEGEEEQSNGTTPSRPPDDPNKYRPFAQMEHTLTTNLLNLISSTPPSALSDPSTMTAGALTMALSYISKSSQSALSTLRGGTTATNTFDSSTGTFSSSDPQSDSRAPTSRILILSVSGDLSAQYIPMMNAIFACQRIRTPIDILKVAGDTVFLQQAADATGGVYMALSSDGKTAGLLQYLMQAYLPDPSARKLLRLPGATHGVDFRAACFCHRRIVDVGFVCSICLSIFCEPLVGDGNCLTCGTALKLGHYGTKPVVIARKRPKKKRKLGGADGREGTPASGADTPGP